MDWLSRWLRTTFDYNPTFPISALLLLAGVKRLASEGTFDAATLLGTAGGISIIQVYEITLLAVALLILWPRRIVYETTSILIIFSIVRFAAPFLVAGFAAEGGNPVEAALVGAVLSFLMAAKTEAIGRRLALDLRPWERVYDHVLHAVASAVLPFLAFALSHGTRSLEASQRIHLATWWTLALVLAPLSAHMGEGRHAAKLWRGTVALAVALLTRNALWIGNEKVVLLSLLPLALVLLSIARTIANASRSEPALHAIHAPAGLAAIVLLLPADELLGRTHVCSRAAALILFAPVAIAWLVTSFDREASRRGLRSLGLVGGCAPIALVAQGAVSAQGAGVYLAVVSVLTVAAGLVRGRDTLVVHGTLGVVVLSSFAARDAVLAAQLAFGIAGLLGLVLAARRLDGPLAERLAIVLATGPLLFLLVNGKLAPASIGASLGAHAGLLCLGLVRGKRELVWVAGLASSATLGRPFVHLLDGGAGLVVLAFGAVAAGTVIAVRRERPVTS